MAVEPTQSSWSGFEGGGPRFKPSSKADEDVREALRSMSEIRLILEPEPSSEDFPPGEKRFFLMNTELDQSLAVEAPQTAGSRGEMMDAGWRI
jgi:hypothetical protein